MNICILIRSLDRGGAERQATQLAEDLAERGHSIRVITFYPNGWYSGRLTKAGITVTTMNKRGRWHIFGFARDLLRELRTDRPDVIYSFLTAANVVAALLSHILGRLPIVWGIRSSDMDLDQYGAVDRLLSRVERALAKTPCLIISNSVAGIEHCVKRGFPAERITYIPNGIDLETFHPNPDARRLLRHRIGIDDQGSVIGMIARYDPMKAVDVFLDAAHQLNTFNPSVHFVLAGTGMEQTNRDINQTVQAYGMENHVTLLGPSNDVPGLLAGLDIATLTSRFGEGFSNVIGEAMACGIPVVATSVGDAAAIIGDTGRVVEPDDPAGLAQAWQEVLDLSPRNIARLGEEAHARIASSYQRHAIAERTETAIIQALQT